jgi:hemerythrin-like domain-containing protein
VYERNLLLIKITAKLFVFPQPSSLRKEKTLKMMPIGPLMIEHRLIEKMIDVIKKERDRIKVLQEINPPFITTLVDFIRIYADRCHHGKEENILFRELIKKPLSIEHKKILYELTEEHKFGRINTGRMDEGKDRYITGDRTALSEIVESMSLIVDFYPKHIEKEDKHFFLPIMRYFSQEEKDAMLKEGFEFDQNLIHQKYIDVVKYAESFYAPQGLVR